MEHSFNIEIAEKYGTNEAVLLNNLYFWIQRNKKNDMNYNDGMYWTYNSVKAFNEIFKYMKPYSIRKALKNLEDNGLIVIGNYNQVAYDRTSWYSITEKGLSELGISICDIRNFHLSKTKNGIVENSKPIPDIKPNNKPDNNTDTSHSDLINLFNQFWQLYPNRKSKKKAEDKFISYLKKQKDVNASFDIIIDGLKKEIMWRKYMSEKGEWTPDWKLPTTWINGECWNDELEIKEEIQTKLPYGNMADRK